MVPQQTLQQIGVGNLMAISGMRAIMVPSLDDERYPDLLLPVGHGYRVRISLTANDTYTVTREMVRGSKVFVKGEQTDVYMDEVGEVAYQAGCYKNVDFGGHKATWS
jgi:hypothetical protein